MKKFIENRKNNILRLLEIIDKPELRILPGQIAFFLVLSIIPILSLVGAIASIFSISMESFIETLEGAMPAQIIEILIPAFTSPNFLTSVSMFFGFIIASNGISSIIVSSNTLFKIENKSFLSRRIKSFVMLVLLVLLFLIILVLLGFGNTLFSWLVERVLDAEISGFMYFTFSVAKWIIGLFMTFIMLKIVFTMAPDTNIPSRYMSKGAVFTTITWIIATIIYSAYVANIANYNIFYGGLAGIAALMIWVYILAYSLVIGIAMNSESYARRVKVNNEKIKKSE